MDIVSSKPVEVIKNHIKKQLKQINKDMSEEEMISTKDMLVEYTEGRGRNCMHFGAGRGDIEVVECLYSMGGTLDTVDKEGNSMLMIGIQHNHKGLVEWLIDKHSQLIE